MAIKIGINGFGRIGKLVFRAAIYDGGFEVVGINDLMDTRTMAHLLKYDSTQGKFKGTVEAVADGIIVNGKKVLVTSEKDPANLPWGKIGADMVLESTGIFADDAGLQKHLDAGAKKVLLSVPPKSKADTKIKIIVMGVNDNILVSGDTMVSNASCTTNCLAPMAKVINENFGIVKGFMTTIHSYTNDQKILDQYHKDPRRARAGAINMIPTTTGAARAVGKVLPELSGKLDGVSVRVPTPDASITDLVAELKVNTRAEDVNAALKAASEGYLKGILEYTEEPIVSSDIIGNPASSVIDGLMTNMLGGNLLKVFAWYDNEWGYSNRCIDLFKKMAK
ncbi:MAG: type I glyceraldehyde-3-phosphate dehydrogenase [Candidatus Latescibacterota bacterium]